MTRRGFWQMVAFGVSALFWAAVAAAVFYILWGWP